jgi:hypothetical protein
MANLKRLQELLTVLNTLANSQVLKTNQTVHVKHHDLTMLFTLTFAVPRPLSLSTVYGMARQLAQI